MSAASGPRSVRCHACGRSPCHWQYPLISGVFVPLCSIVCRRKVEAQRAKEKSEIKTAQRLCDVLGQVERSVNAGDFSNARAIMRRLEKFNNTEIPL